MTITEIAEIAGVSPATVSRVFNHSEMVSENTKQKVLKAIKEYDYIPNPSFGNLSLQRIKIDSSFKSFWEIFRVPNLRA